MVARIYTDTVDFEPAEREEWMSRGSCTSRDPKIFFAEGKGSVKEQTDKAKEICNTICSVRLQCLARALQQEKGTGRRFGVSGGLTPTEREQLQLKLDEMQGASNEQRPEEPDGEAGSGTVGDGDDEESC